ncbi:MAG: hypothetical protein NTW03_19860 [Verrucomicrobia bacterium]|nr:hypothetical protein [Verrucomicrobiota bacterium]
MKNLFLKFKISSSLNRGVSLSPFWRGQVSASPELQSFAQSALELDRKLRQPAGPDASALPPTLHAGIMRAVRRSQPAAAGAAPAFSVLPAVLRWGLATTMGLALAVGGWQAFFHRDATTTPAVTGVEAGLALPAIGPAMAQLATDGMAMLNRPMTRQGEDLSRDLRETAQFLLASLP